MKIGNIGMSLSAEAGFRQLKRLEELLGMASGAGVRLLEIGITPFPVIMNGELRAREVANLVAVLRNFDLRYTLHGYNRLNLAYDARRELCQQIMRCQIEVARQMGAGMLVYHSGLQALDAVRHGVRRSLLSAEELCEGALHEIVVLRQLAPLAADAGVMIGMENGDSHQWEHNLIAHFDLPREALLQHHARLQIPPIVRQLEQIDQPNVGMTLDIAHLHIAAHDMGFDYLQAVSEAAPWVRHLHVNDNFGKLDYGFDAEPERWAFGEADIHLPPGWGSIPYQEVFARLPKYQGDLILEIKGAFTDFGMECVQAMQQLVDQAR